MKTVQIVLVMLIFLIFTSVSTIFASTKSDKSNYSTDKGTVSSSGVIINDLKTASALAEYGSRSQNPMALVVAAQILKSTPTQKQNREKSTEILDQNTPESPSSPATSESVLNAEQLLTEALGMTQDPTIVEMIEKTFAMEGTRGRKEGPVEHEDTVSARTTDVYKVTMKAREIAKVVIISDEKNDIDLYIYDENDNMIIADNDDTSHCYVEWTPKWEGEFTIKVRNNGSTPSRYILLTN
jgi:hypothetical protein